MNNKNDENCYRIFAFRWWGIVLYVLIGFILPLIIVGYFNSFEPIIFFATLGLSNVFAFFIVKSVCLQSMNVRFDDEKIVLEYLSEDLNTVKKSQKILLKYIVSFSDYSFRGEPTFNLKLQHGFNISFYKNDLWNKKDDFEILIEDFKKHIENYNSNSKTPETLNAGSKLKIEYQDFFQTTKAKIIFYISIIMQIYILFVFFTGKTENSSAGFIASGGLLAYIAAYISKRKFNNQQSTIVNRKSK